MELQQQTRLISDVIDALADERESLYAFLKMDSDQIDALTKMAEKYR